MDKMWAGRFQKALNKEADDFNSSIHFDSKMYVQDIKGSIAHASMLVKQGIISKDDFDKNLMLCEISNALDKIKINNSYVKSDIGKYATILKLEGATDTEIAKILGSHPSNIKRSIEITIKRLQKILKIEV